MLSKKVPGKAKRKENLIRNEWSIKAMRALKQARRAEQILYRSEAMDGKEQSKKEQYMKLNREAAKLMRKNVDRKNEWEEDLNKEDEQNNRERKSRHHGDTGYQKSSYQIP